MVEARKQSTGVWDEQNHKHRLVQNQTLRFPLTCNGSKITLAHPRVIWAGAIQSRRPVSDYDQYRTNRDPSSGPPSYRVIIVAKSGTVLNSKRISASNDDDAIHEAKSMFDGQAIEIWDGLRLIEQLPSID